MKSLQPALRQLVEAGLVEENISCHAFFVTPCGSSLLIPGRGIKDSRRVLATRDVEPKEMTTFELLTVLKDEGFSMRVTQTRRATKFQPFEQEGEKIFYVKETAQSICHFYLLAVLLTYKGDLQGPLPHFQSEGFYRAFTAGQAYVKKARARRTQGPTLRASAEADWPDEGGEIDEAPCTAGGSGSDDSDDNDSSDTGSDSSDAGGSDAGGSDAGSDKSSSGSSSDSFASTSESGAAPPPVAAAALRRIQHDGQWGNFRITPKEKAKDGVITSIQMTCWHPHHKAGDQKQCTKTYTTARDGAELCLRKLKTWALQGIECATKQEHQEMWPDIATVPESDVFPDEILNQMMQEQDAS